MFPSEMFSSDPHLIPDILLIPTEHCKAIFTHAFLPEIVLLVMPDHRLWLTPLH